MEQDAVIKHNIEKAPRTGNWRYMKPVVNKKKCVGCGTCVKYCPEAAIELAASDKRQAAKNKKVAEIDYDFCKGCGVCAAECPQKAIVMIKE
ncbi:MAG: 4Fe-4S binding protein [Candidatus Moranbacteria bacterium]|nr:4Fe-4S binding protein [Candidatus Moranbacteria bacterium]